MSLRILLLVGNDARHTGTVDDHIRAFIDLSAHQVLALDSYVASKLRIDLGVFDAVVFHYSIVISLPSFLPEPFADRLARFAGPKVLFIQDEFRWVNRTMAAARRLGVTTVFTVVNEDVTRKIYREPYFDGVRFEHTLTGFVPQALIGRAVPPYQARPIDVSYRARRLPAWCGSFALQKWQIGERFLADAARHGLSCDIAMSEASRIYGERWIDFVAGSKAVLGTESGASFIDYTGEVCKAIEAYEASHPGASFEEIRDRFLEGRDGEVTIHVISPRVFEAACLRTLMIMYPGDYSGAVRPGRHYVPLLPDHSNMAEVAAIIRNPDRAGEIIDNAYREVACSDRWTFGSFIRRFDAVVEEEGRRCAARAPGGVGAGTHAPDDSRAVPELQRTGAAADRPPAQGGGLAREERSRRQQAEFKRLARAHARRLNWHGGGTRLALLLQRAGHRAFSVVSRRLPPSVAGPLLALGQGITGRLKPILRQVLLRRVD